MVSLVVSVAIHVLVATLAWSVSPFGAARAVARAPIRLHYLAPPRVLVEPSAGVLRVPDADDGLVPLAARPLTVPSEVPLGAVPGVPVEAVLGAPGEGAPGGDAAAPGGGPSPVNVGPESALAQPEPPPAVAAEEPPPAPRGGEAPRPARSSTASVSVQAPQQQVAALPPAPAPTPPSAKVETTARLDPAPAAPPPVARGGVVEIDGTMPRPVIVQKVVPKYNPVARSQRIKGTVEVLVSVDTEGRVTNAEVLSSPSPLLNKEALDAARGMRFKPYEIGGQVVPFKTRIPFRFDFK